jgi:hypothetical protein
MKGRLQIHSTLDSLVLKAKQLARSGDDGKAMSLADELVGRYPNGLVPGRTRRLASCARVR